MNRLSIALSLLAALPAGAFEPTTTAVSLGDLLRDMKSADLARRESFPGYSGLRQYTVENKRFGVHATMRARVEVARDGSKRFEVLETTGSSAIRKMVFRRIIDTETRSSAPDAQAASRISPDNYKFQFTRIETLNGRRTYVLQAEPIQSSPVLFRGTVWVDAASFAVVRIEGAPAQNPSFWVQRTHFIHEYKNVKGYWLATTNRSESDVRIFGHTIVNIEYSDYRINDAEASR